VQNFGFGKKPRLFFKEARKTEKFTTEIAKDHEEKIKNGKLATELKSTTEMIA